MKKKSGMGAVRISAATAFLVMIAVNILANALPLNNVTTGQVADAYPNLFTPADITFSIWGVIYLLLAMYVLYLLGLFQGRGQGADGRLLRQTGWLFTLSSLVNAAWIIAWHYFCLPLTVLLMLALLAALILITLALQRENLTRREKLFLRLPFSVYLAWISVAAIANITVLLVSLGWNGFGLPPQVWTVIVLFLGALIGVTAVVNNSDPVFGLVMIWAYLGIYLRQVSPAGWGGQYPAVVFAVWFCIAAFLIAGIYALAAKNTRRRG